ncbi:TrlF family AAA-like ATPase [Yersinia enterocolitica]
MNKLSRGSEWSVWDLHFHTPSSYDYKNKEITNEEIIQGLSENNVSVVSVTDHHFIDIPRIKELQRIGATKNITVLPGIEFLSDARGRDPVHFIGIFPEDCNIEYIWSQIENKTAISDIKGKGKRENEVYCHIIDTMKIIKALGGIITIHAGEKSGSLENITNSLPHSVAQKTDIAELVDIFELGKESDQEGYNKFVFPNIRKILPMIMCSDNHHIRKYSTKKKTWIKGFKGFKGLKYALNEPQGRFYIGDEPDLLKRVNKNKTKYIKELTIKRSGSKDESHIWFENITIPINSELVTIIGNKGGGKSAISDILAYCSDAEHSEDYLFLNKNKFKKRGLADRFIAQVTFESGYKTDEKSLFDDIQGTEERKVRYLPQSYFEKICNEIDKVDAFRKEIEKVVFQYVPIENRLNKNSFRELIEYKKEALEKDIFDEIEKINVINNKIISLEDKSNPDFIKNIESKIRLKQEELRVHIQSKPNVVIDPTENNDTPEISERKRELTALNEEKKNIDELISRKKEMITKELVDIEEINSASMHLEGKVNELISLIDFYSEKLTKYGFNVTDLISVNYNSDRVDNKILDINRTVEKYKIELYGDSYSIEGSERFIGLEKQSEMLSKKIEVIQNEFSGEQKVYQDYLTSLGEWTKQKKEIEGDATTPDSLNFLIFEQSYLKNDLIKEILVLRDERLNLSKCIFDIKIKIKNFYDEIKKEIDSKLDDEEITGLSIESSLNIDSDFSLMILREIRQNRIGSFYGTDDGRTLLQNELINNIDWNNKDDVVTFLTKIIEFLEEDKRNNITKSKTFIGNVVRNRDDLYNYLFSLRYLNPYYDLQQNKKSLEQLSPGEKGALLLVFYLVLDKEDIPLIIDQPEDNLDNNSVAKFLVPFIKRAKSKRQIIMVTHNPNLAVVSDSEQVIRTFINKEKGNEFNFISGGIDEDSINDTIVEVLEGTIPAFTNRQRKYGIK